jgi:hypothetical protein
MNLNQQAAFQAEVTVAEIERITSEILAKVAAFPRANWGDVGSLGYVREQLASALAHLS